jgi:cytochrome c553
MKLYSLITATLLVSTIFSGCSSDDNKNDTKNEHKATTKGSVPQIEIVKNDNAQEIKVKNKNKNTSKNNSYYYDYGQKSEYNQNAQPANKDASVRVRPRTVIDANMNIRSPYEKVQISLLVNKLSKKFIIKCSACHNDYANGIIGPSLLNRDSDYIFTKIQEFKTGKKSNPLMNDLIKMMSDEEIRSMANEIYNFNNEIKKMENK